MSIDVEKLRRGLDLAFIQGYNYSWIRDKLIMNDLILNYFDDFLKLLREKTIFEFRSEQRDDFLMMIRAESIILTVKYSEDLASISIAFGRGHFKINETLRTYKTATIRKFFKNVTEADYRYMQKVLGYPDLEELEPNRRVMIEGSVERAKQYYKQIGAFYSKYCDLYNCYKHGLRLMPVKEGKTNTSILKFPSLKTGEFEVEVIGEKEYKNATDIAGLIFTLMHVMFQNHRAWYLGKGEKYECLVIPPIE